MQHIIIIATQPLEPSTRRGVRATCGIWTVTAAVDERNSEASAVSELGAQRALADKLVEDGVDPRFPVRVVTTGKSGRREYRTLAAMAGVEDQRWL